MVWHSLENDRSSGGVRSVDADALNLVMPVDNVSCNTKILARFADRPAFQLRVYGDRGVCNVTALFDLDLLGIIDVEHILYELFRVVRIFHDLDVLAGLLFELDYMLTFLTDCCIPLPFLHNENEFLFCIHTVDDVRFGYRFEQGYVSEGILG